MTPVDDIFFVQIHQDEVARIAFFRRPRRAMPKRSAGAVLIQCTSCFSVKMPVRHQLGIQQRKSGLQRDDAKRRAFQRALFSPLRCAAHDHWRSGSGCHPASRGSAPCGPLRFAAADSSSSWRQPHRGHTAASDAQSLPRSHHSRDCGIPAAAERSLWQRRDSQW